MLMEHGQTTRVMRADFYDSTHARQTRRHVGDVASTRTEHDQFRPGVWASTILLTILCMILCAQLG